MERYGCIFSNINDPSTLKRNSTYFGSSWEKQNDKKTRKLQRFFAHFAFALAQHIEEVQSIANRVSVPLKTALYDFIVGFIKSMTGWKGSRKTVESAKVSVYDLNVGQKQLDFNSKQTLLEVTAKLKSTAGRGRYVKGLCVVKKKEEEDDKDFGKFEEVLKKYKGKIRDKDFGKFEKALKKYKGEIRDGYKEYQKERIRVSKETLLPGKPVVRDKEEYRGDEYKKYKKEHG
jgi:hypothetical protein